MIIIFSGSIGRLPVGGHAWIDMQYLAGLSALGHEVYYLEDCGEESWVYNWDTEELTTDLSYPANYVRDCLEPLGLEDRWIYRAGNQSRGMSIDAFLDICARADLMIIRAVPLAVWRDEYTWSQKRCYIDADPGFNQISLLQGNSQILQTVNQCERLFTIAQRIGAADCPIPTAGREWIRTVAPVSLMHWEQIEESPSPYYTTIMQWKGFREVEFEGMLYGQKDKEFPKFIDLPLHTEQKFCIALTGTSPDDLIKHGWNILEGWIVSKTPWSYRDFIRTSRAEFSIAKHGYAAMRGGWFSDRSVCYLASGRPVLVQDTGLDDWIPTGEGILSFRDLQEAVSGIETINADYDRHRRAARHLAEQYFDAMVVLPPLLEAAMN